MSDETFEALLLRQGEDGRTVAGVETLGEEDLPSGDVLVGVEYSTVNYKDALAVSGRGKIVRRWPMVPGIDLAGTVLYDDLGAPEDVFGELTPAVAVVLQQMKGHALRRLWPDTGQATQRLDQPPDKA